MSAKDYAAIAIEVRHVSYNAGMDPDDKANLEAGADAILELEAELTRLRAKIVEHSKRELLNKMCEISEAHWCAGWMSNLEFDLWKIWDKKDKSYGMGRVSDEDCALLKQLSEDCGGWFMWDNELGSVFVTTGEFKARVAVKETA